MKSKSKSNILETTVKMSNMRREILNHNLKGFVLRCWMGQSAEQSRDVFKDVYGELSSELKPFWKCLPYIQNTRSTVDYGQSEFEMDRTLVLTLVNRGKYRPTLSSASSVSTLMPRPYFFLQHPAYHWPILPIPLA